MIAKIANLREVVNSLAERHICVTEISHAEIQQLHSFINPFHISSLYESQLHTLLNQLLFS